MTDDREDHRKPKPGSAEFLSEDEETTAIEVDATGSKPSAPTGASVLSPPSGPSLAAGEVLDGRFRVVRRLGKGGMGEVYEAFDLELGEPLALKTLRPSIAADPAILARFRREIQIARKVTHPNICRLYDMRHHRPQVDGGPAREITFLTMELLAGQTLSRRVRQEGRLVPDEALPLAKQMALGLAAAHRAGVIHRDLKTSNVMLVPTSEGIRAVITDFGLARAAEPSSGAASLTGTELIIGSPSYMAPEQVAGEPVGPAADIYSFGIMLYEMVTGTVPYLGESAIAIAVKRLHEPPRNPREHAPELPLRWEAAILRCLARQPEERFSNPQEVVRALEPGGLGLPPGPPPLAGSGGPGSWRALWAASPLGRFLPSRVAVLLVVVSVIVLLALGSLRWFLGASQGDGPPPAVQAGERSALAVLTFRNLTGAEEVAWLSDALAELLTTDLAAGTEILLVPRETVSQVQADLQLPATSTLAEGSLQRLRARLAAEYVLAGSYLASEDGSLQVDLNVQNADTGATRASLTETGTEKRLGRLVSQLADQVRKELGVPNPRGPVAQLATPEATRLYAEGIAHLRAFEPGEARDLLLRAVEADPASARGYSALAKAWKELGYEHRTREAAQKALDLSADLTWEERQLLRGRFEEAARQWPRAIEAYRSLWTIFSDNLEHGLQLAAAQVEAGEGAAALETVQQLRQLPAPARDDPRVDLAEANAARSQSLFDRQLEAARRAVEHGNEIGARLLVARGQRLEGEALERQGDFSGAQKAYRDSIRLHGQAGDRVGEARGIHDMAISLARQGSYREAVQLLQQALATYKDVGAAPEEARALSNLGTITEQTLGPEAAISFHQQDLELTREIGDLAGEARALTSLGRIARQQGELERAAGRFREALTVWRQVGDRHGQAVSMNSLANIRLDQGRIAEARDLFSGALEIFRELGDPGAVAQVLSNLGAIEAEEARLGEAEKLHRQALEAYQQMGARPQEALELRYLAQLARRRGDLDGARKLYAEALALWDEGGAVFQATTARLELAALLGTGGKGDEALDLLPRVREAIPASAAKTPQARALAAQAWALEAYLRAARKELPAAKRAIAQARRLSEDLEPEVVLWIDISAARVQAADGKRREARQALAAVVEATQGQPFLADHAFEARLALGEIEEAAGLTGPGLGTERLAKLEAEARKRGQGLLAQRAAGLFRQAPR